MIPYDEQLVGGVVLHQGKISEMKNLTFWSESWICLDKSENFNLLAIFVPALKKHFNIFFFAGNRLKYFAGTDAQRDLEPDGVILASKCPFPSRFVANASDY